MSYLFARPIAVHLALSPSPRKKGSREVENETKLGRSRIERVKGGNRVCGKARESIRKATQISVIAINTTRRRLKIR